MASDSPMTETQAIIRRLRAELLPGIAKAVVPIFGLSEQEQFVQDRTGVLLQVNEGHFLLTASHGLRQFVAHPIPLGISPSRAGEPPIHLLNSTFHSIEEDNVDVTVVRLDNETVQALLPQRRFLRLHEVEQGVQASDGLYLVFGYPCEWTTSEGGRIASRPMIFLGRQHTGELNPISETDPAIHLVLSYDRQGIDVVKDRPATLPTVNGMSGCGIWKIADWNSGALQNCKPDKSRLVAIQHSWDQDRNYVKGTWVRHTLGLIHEHYPDLRAALEMVY